MMRLLSRRIGQLTTTNDRPDLDHPSSSSIIDEHLRSISDQQIRSIFARIKVSFSPRSSAFSRLKPQQSLLLLLVERDLQLGIEQVPLVDNVALRNTPPIAEQRSHFDLCDKKQIKQIKGATNYYFSYLFTCKPARAFRLLEALLLRLDLPPIHRRKGLGFDWSIITKLTHLFHGFRHFSKPEVLHKFLPDPDLTTKTALFLNCAKATLCGENWHKNSSTRK